MTKLRWRAPALALCLALTAVPGQAFAQGDLTKGARDMNVRAGTAEFRDVSFGTDDTGSVTIGKISFIGFARDSDRVRADRVEIEKLTGRIGTRVIEVPTITVAAFEGPADLFRALSEGGNAERDWIALLQKAAARQIIIDRMLDHNPALSFESEVSTISINDVKNGFVGSAKLAGMTGSGNAPPNGKMSLKLGELRYQGVDIAESIRLLSGGGSGEPKRLIERVVMDGMDIKTSEATMRFDRIEMANFRARAPSEGLSPADRIALQTGKAFDDPEVRKRMARFFGEIARTASLERYSLEGFTVSIPQGPFSIKAITFGGLSGRGLDLFEIRNMDVPTPSGPVRLGRFAIEKLTYGPMVDALLAAVASGQDPDFDPAKVIAIAPRLAAIRMGGIEVSTPEGPVSLGGFDVELDDRAGAIPERIAASIKQLKVKIDRTAPDEGRKQLLAMGYNEFAADAAAQLRWLRSDKALVIDNTNLVMDKVGRIDLAARLGNADLAAAIGDPSVVDNAKIESIELKVRNLGVAERFYGLTAKSAGISQDAVREGLAAEVKSRAAAMFGPALAPGSADAIARFLRTPGTLVARATLKPGRSLTVGEATDLDPPQLLERLTITIETPPN